MYEYKAVPFLASVPGRDPKSADEASKQLTKAINTNARDGWEFYQLEAVSVEVIPDA